MIAVSAANVVVSATIVGAVVVMPLPLQALRVMEQQLQKTPYLTGEHATTADISLYAYTHVAHEGGFELADYPAILAWLKRVASLPDFKPMA